MLRMKTFISAVTAAMGLLALMPVAQAATAKAELYNIQFELVDLRPDDGIAPSFNASSLIPFNSMNILSNWGAVGVDSVIGGARTLTYRGDGVDVFAASTLDGRSLLASVSDHGPHQGASAYSVSSSPVLLGEPCCLAVLSAYTQLIVRGTARLSIPNVRGTATASFQAGGDNIDLRQSMSIGHGDFFPPGPSADPTLFKEASLTLTIDNDTAQDASFYLTLGASAFIPRSTVPEPGVVLLAGAGVACVLATRKRQRT
jgi:hypothetical protein